ncbi:YihY/virulence factor BrkB family protein [Henriciella marina]|uniref:YihY/virulence factor BrkB family protein n=1 Tax=Henriciella marina TaxID=453851 RepID=A0ABT4LUJ9_9PROT|nr:YihY/virulence factor BrkB family protein [Henriciella marina]MCZ4298031.1 YihY/virulence factor BrkB family protein [Henriciella marina]
MAGVVRLMVGSEILYKIRNAPFYKRWGHPVVNVVTRTFARIGDDDVALVSGGVAFYAFLSVFPAVACALMVWGLFTSSADLRDYFEIMQTFLPEEAYRLITAQMIRIAESQSSGLSWGALVSLVIALWSASRGANALLLAIAVTYDRPAKRGFLQQNLLALGFTAGAIVFAIISLAAIGAVPPIIEALQLGAFLDALLRIIRWLGLISLFLLGIYAFMRTARPHTVRSHESRARPILPGAIVAGIIWLLASVAFSFYLSAFADYNETFGSLGAVAALLMWLWLSSFAICAGAEVNGVISRRERGLTTKTAKQKAEHTEKPRRFRRQKKAD